MNKIKVFKYMSSIKKSELYSFMSTLIVLKAELDKEDDDRPDIISEEPALANYNAVSTNLQNLVTQLGKSFNKKTPSPESIYLSEQNKLMKSAFSSIRQVISANLRFKTSTDYNQILEFSLLLRKYSKISTASTKEITALVDNFLHDIDTTNHKALTSKLLLTEWIASMNTANQNFKNYSLKRSDTYEQIVSYNYRMKQDIIDNYHELEFCINALAFNGMLSKYDAFANSLNGTITDYMDIIQKRLSKNKNKKDNDRPEIISENKEF